MRCSLTPQQFVNDVLVDLQKESKSEHLNHTSLPSFSLDKCGILLCGDFNIAADTQLYDSMFMLFHLR